MQKSMNRKNIVRIGIAAATLALAVSLPHLAGAQYYGIPQAQTGQATSMTQNSAVVNGWVNPNNSATSYRFEYGTSYGSLYQNTQFFQLGSGNGSIPVSAVLSSLMPNTTYYVRLVAQNASGQADGGVVTFQTTTNYNNPYNPYNPYYPYNQNQYGTGNISISPQNITLSVGQSYYFSAFYDPDGPGGSTGQVSVSTMANWNTSNPNVIVHLGGGHFVAQSGGTATVTASYQNGFGQATVSIYQAQSATIAETQYAANVTQTSATLRGAVNPQGTQTTAYFEYGTTSSLGTRVGDQTLYGVSGSQYLTHQVTNLSPNTTYFYRVVSQNQNGVSYGSVLQFTTGRSGSSQTTGGSGTTYQPPVVQPPRPTTPPRPTGNTGTSGTGTNAGTGTSVVAITAGTEQGAGQLPVTVSTMRPEPGSIMTYTIRYSVTGGAGVKGATLALVLPPEIELLSTTPAPSATSVNGATFSLGDLAAGTNGTANAMLRVKDTAKPGDQLIVTAILNYTGSAGQMQSGTATTPLTVVQKSTNDTDSRGTLASASAIPGGSLVVWLLIGLLLVNIAHFAYHIAKTRRKRPAEDSRAAVYATNHYGTYPGDRKEKQANPSPRITSHAAMMQQSPLVTQSRSSAQSENGIGGVHSNGFGLAKE